MANTYTTLNSLFTGIADAIRAKKGSAETILADTFPTEIENLTTGFDYSNQYITVMPNYTFYECKNLKSVDCYNLTNIGVSTFENCTNLQSVILWDNVESIGENAFKGCSKLIIYCEANEKPETWHENWNPDGCKVVWGFAPIETWDISATSEDNATAKLYSDVLNEGMYTLVIDGSGNMLSYENWNINNNVPWTKYKNNINNVIINKDITSISDYAFYNCTRLINIKIPDNVTSIGYYAFRNCTRLINIKIPDSVTSIGSGTFYDCTSLTSVIFGKNSQLTTISNSAFNHCKSLTSITIPNNITRIGNGAFQYCTSLTSITIPDSVTIIGGSVFSGCSSLTSITIPDSITSINAYAFSQCKNLTSISIPDSITHIYNEAFKDCSSLTSIAIPDSVTSIGNSAFEGCSSLTNIVIPDGITNIGYRMFFGCSSLTNIVIPDSVTNIGSSAFDGCSSLIDIHYTGTISQWQAITFGTSWSSNTPNYTIHCTDGDIAKDGTITYHNN